MYLYILATVLLGGVRLCRGISSPITTFSSCGASGPFGPTQSQCSEAYAETEHMDVFDLLVVNGKQIITIPFPGVYRFEAFGAGGISSEPSLGAYVKGEFPLPQGAVVKLLVGQKGDGDEKVGAFGGSGGTFIARSGESEPMLVAGGAASAISAPVGVHASRFTAGVNASSIGLKYGSAGTDGNGGKSSVDNKGGGGAGFMTSGEAADDDDTTVIQAQSFTLPGSILAGTGGRGDGASDTVFNGGFGGGGYAFESSSGGGGGYSGGGGASDGAIPGGGGSFLSGLNTQSDVSNPGDGKITVQFIDSGIETGCSEHSFTVSLFKELVYDATEFTLEDSSCTSTFNDTHVIIESGLDECGTRVTFGNGSMVHFRNTIKRSGQSKGPTRYIISDIEVTCSYSLQDAVTLNILPDVGTVNFQPEVEEGDFLISTRAFKTIEYNTPYAEEDFPLRVSTDQNIFLEVGLSIELDLPDVVLQLDNCFASPSKNVTVEPKHAMIERDCDVDGTLEFLPSSNDVTKRFMFKPVAFTLDHISSAFIHCEASLCQSNETFQCRKGCSRRKRHIVIEAGESFYGDAINALKRPRPAGSIGPFIISDNSAKRSQQSSTITILVLVVIQALLVHYGNAFL